MPWKPCDVCIQFLMLFQLHAGLPAAPFSYQPLLADSSCYCTPQQEAFLHGDREKLIYVPCIVPSHDRPDYLATVDVDPTSASYGKVRPVPPIYYHSTHPIALRLAAACLSL